ncbi:MAG: hypothetical protein M1327_00980 [Candidatus Thermoplasmatota archaeon]|nr:hypothetical protein [Candidatus Thermoplasmatota archaeon]
MAGESHNDDKVQNFRSYLGLPEPDNSSSYKKRYENEIIEGIYSAFKEGRKYYVQIVKSFDLKGLNSALLYIYTQLSKNGVNVVPLEKLDFEQSRQEGKNNVVYLISDRYIDSSDPASLKFLSNLIAGEVPKNAEGSPIVLGLTDQTFRRINKFRSKKEIQHTPDTSYSQASGNRTLGSGLVLLSLTFLATGIGTVIDRPEIYDLSVFTVSWIIFSLSMIGIIGFLLVLFGSLQTRSKRNWTLGISFLIIAATQIASVFIQFSSLSLNRGGGFELVLSSQAILPKSNAFILPEIYTGMAMLLAIACYLLIFTFARHTIKILGLFALIIGIAAQIFTLVGILLISRLFFPLILAHYSNFLFISFYNNVTAILPYPSVILNVTDFIFPLRDYPKLFLYFEVGLASISNFLFFISYFATGSTRGRHNDSTNPRDAS